MEVEKNVKIQSETRGGWNKSEEVKQIEIFLNSNDENICFTYGTCHEAADKASSLRSYIHRKKHPIKLIKRKRKIYIVRRNVYE